VEDMVAIVEALGEYREQRARGIAKGKNMVLSETVKERTRWKRGKEKLLYWGFSYGTVLGATFAAMHPDRIGRLVLDGVVDTDDYYARKTDGNHLKCLY
jgi:pimeloyl-ACP methyl ester carboxylesterase